jgi:hypothetical protein
MEGPYVHVPRNKRLTVCRPIKPRHMAGRCSTVETMIKEIARTFHIRIGHMAKQIGPRVYRSHARPFQHNSRVPNNTWFYIFA